MDGKYTKPSSGIPKSDLASAVQTSLGKADTALQSYTEQYKGTITGIKMNGASKGTSGVVDLGTVITAHQDISGKQDKLESGTNIKTINGTSILGSGNITIEGGSGGSSYAGNYPVVHEDVNSSSPKVVNMLPNTYYILDKAAMPGRSLTLNLVAPSDNTIINEYIIEFSISASLGNPSAFSLPASIKWANDDVIVIQASHTYIISIVNDIAAYIDIPYLIYPEAGASGGPTG